MYDVYRNDRLYLERYIRDIEDVVIIFESHRESLNSGIYRLTQHNYSKFL